MPEADRPGLGPAPRAPAGEIPLAPIGCALLAPLLLTWGALLGGAWGIAAWLDPTRPPGEAVALHLGAAAAGLAAGGLGGLAALGAAFALWPEPEPSQGRSGPTRPESAP